MSNLSRNTLRILIIEDNHADAEMIRIYLEESSLQFVLTSAESLSGGLKKLEEEPVDLVLLDLGLPDTTGFNTLRKYLERSPDIPVVVMTGLNDQRRGTESVRAGAQDYLVKGEFDSRQLIKVIRYSLERFRLQAAADQRASLFSEEKSRLKELQQMSSMGDWVMDIVSNTMIWSEELFRIFDLSANAFSPALSDYLQFVHREDGEKVESFFAQAVQFEEFGPLEHRVMIDNRIVKKVTLRTRIKFDEKTNKVLLLGSVQDTTPRENEQVKKLPAQATPGNEERDPIYTRELFNQISFNIRTPLSTAVHLFYLLEQTNLNANQTQLVQDLKTTIDDLSFTLSNLVNLSILSNDNSSTANDYFRPLDVLESIQRVLTFKAQQNNREIDIYLDPRLAVNVQGDSNKLAQLFFCMMELAFLQSDNESFVKLRCILDEEQASPQLSVQLEYSGRLPQWPVEEKNIRAEEILSWLQPKPNDQGREQILGTVFQRICQQMEIDCQASFAKGGVFIDLLIPIQMELNYSVVIPSKPERELHILLVEDHPMHQIATKQVLTTWSDKVSVTVASNGKIAVGLMQEQHFDLVLMDLQMPVMDGMTATTQIRGFSSVPIIALTANNSKQEEDRCYQLDMNDYLAKPFQPEDLYRRIMLLIHEEVKV